MVKSYLETPDGQTEYEIYLLQSQAESLLQDLDDKKSLSTFRNNILSLKKCQAVISAILYTIEKER